MELPNPATLESDALSRFQPFVFAFTSETPSNVNFDRILESRQRDEVFLNHLFFLDAKKIAEAAHPAKPTSKGKGSNVVVSTEGKCIAELLREEATRIAIEREMDRRKVIEAAAAELEFLISQYLEDGMDPEQARATAQADMQEAEETGSAEEGDDGTKKREPLFLCIKNYPSQLNDMVDLSKARLPIHALINVDSRVPLTGSLTSSNADAQIQERSKHGKQDRSRSARRSTKVSGTDKTAPSGMAALLKNFQKKSKPSEHSPLDEVYAYNYEFPSEKLPSSTPNDSQTDSYKLIGSEKSGFDTIMDTLIVLEERFHAFTEWKSQRQVFVVPRYSVLKSADAVKEEPVAPIIDERSAKRKSSPSKRKANDLHSPIDESAQQSAALYADPKSMADFTACKDVYMREMRTALEKGESFSVALFARCCVQQVEATLQKREVMLPSQNDLAMAELQSEREKISAYAQELANAISSRKNDTEAALSTTSAARAAVSSGVESTLPVGDQVKVDAESDQSTLESRLQKIAETARPALASNPKFEDLLKAALVADASAKNKVLSLDFMRHKNKRGWIQNREQWGAFTLDLFSRGNGKARTQLFLSQFHGRTTFPEYMSWCDFVQAESEYYFPPAPDSEADNSENDEGEEEEEEEEEEIETEDGEIIFRKKKRPTPPLPPLDDFIGIMQTELRRRNLFEFMKKRIDEKHLSQELISLGSGAKHVAEEVEWLFLSDGGCIEVERTVCNTRQVNCDVNFSDRLSFGFFLEEPPNVPLNEVPDSVPSEIRTFFRCDDLHFTTEIIGDNTNAAQKVAYERAVINAKAEAALQFEAQSVKTKGPKNKDKNAAPPPTQQMIEEMLISAIPTPQQRENEPPRVLAVARWTEIDVQETFNMKNPSVQLTKHKPIDIFPVRTNFLEILELQQSKLERRRIQWINHIVVNTDGTIEIASEDAPSTRILLDPHGGYVTQNDPNIHLYVSPEGKCIAVTKGFTSHYGDLMTSSKYSETELAMCTSREDGVMHILLDNMKVKYSQLISCEVDSQNSRFTWCIKGFPIVTCDLGKSELWAGYSETMVGFNFSTNQIAISRAMHIPSFKAVMDVSKYQLLVDPTGTGNSLYIIDTAFGGLWGSASGEKTEETKEEGVSGSCVYRVSAFGRCSEERNSLLVLPPSVKVHPLVPPVIIMIPELWCPRFVQTLEGTNFSFEGCALCNISNIEVLPLKEIVHAPSLTQLGQFSDAIRQEAFHGCAQFLRAELESKNSMGKDLLRCVIFKHTHSESPKLLFLPWFSLEFITRVLLERIDPSHSGKISLETPSQTNSSPAANFFELAIQPMPLQDGCATPSNKEAEHYKIVKISEDNFPVRFSALQYIFAANSSDGITKNHPKMHLLIGTSSPRDESIKEVARNFTNQKKSAASVRQQAKNKSSTRCIPGRLNYFSSEVFNNAILPHGQPADMVRRYRAADHRAVEENPLKDAPEMTISSDRDESNDDVTNSNINSPHANIRHKKSKGKSSIKLNVLPDGVPLMVSSSMRTAYNTGTTSSSRGHLPFISVSPTAVSFGQILKGRVYGYLIYITNISTVPSRFRFSIPVECKPHVFIDYPHHFLAPGITETAELRILGTQEPGEWLFSLSLIHEGGTTMIDVSAQTVVDDTEIHFDPETVYCIGPSQTPFEPGVTIRMKQKAIEEAEEAGILIQNESENETDSNESVTL